MSGCFSCALIGDGSLLIQCAQQLLHNGHHINVIITLDTSTKAWADSNGIPTIEARKTIYSPYLSSIEFDYLFSIVHLEVIPGDVLAMAKKLSINYHDALLPAYAGIHATSWALINQESIHGITWHEMLPTVDEGRILVQRQFDAELCDTAFSLNLKCYEAAIESFGELIHNLAAQNIKFVTQDLSKRTYFSKYQRPENMGLIAWKSHAKSVQAFINGLHFGNYDNPLATPKFYCGGKFFCVDAVIIAPEKTASDPGIMHVTRQGELRVTTETQDIILLGLKQLNGNSITPQTFIQSHASHPIEDYKVSRLQQSNYLQSARGESYWVNIFKAFDIDNDLNSISMEKASHHREWDAPASLLAILDNHDITVLICGFLSRSRKAETYIVGVESPHADDKNFYLRHLPLVWSLADDTDFDALRTQLLTQLHKLSQNPFCPIDIFARYPSLDSARMDEQRYKFEVSVVICHTDAEFLAYDPIVASHGITLLLDKSSHKWHLFAGGEAEHALMSSFEKKLNRFISLISTNAHNLPVSRINLLLDEEIKLLDDVNRQNKDYPSLSTVELFYQQAQANPQKISVVCEGETFTYHQLQQRVDQIAAQLLTHKVMPGDRVGVLLTRSFDMIAALLGTMRAGAIYIPLDPIYPDERLQHMIDDSGLKILLTQSSIQNGLDREYFSSLNIDQINTSTAETTNTLAFPGIEDSAYIIYTSGSTGKPKGVEVTHRGLTNFLVSMAEAPGFTANDHLLSVTTVCFDIAGLELYLPLIKGGTVEICSAQDAKDGFALLEKLQAGNITLLQATPTTWEMLLAAGWDEKLSLKALCGGEPLRKELANQLIPRCGELWNMYGPTETTIWSSIQKITDATRITVGQPIANTTFYVLDDYLNPVSIEEKGELYIGGDGLARGYWQREALTAEKFVPDPFSRDPESRLYRTGDAACLLSSGEFSCLGRIDNQIKLNGYRIELGEIETAIESLADVEKAVVTVQSSEQSGSLHAFVLYTNQAAHITETRFKQHLASFLPEYMIPGHFHTVTAFPLTLNGKVDRKVLTTYLSNTEISKDAPAAEVPVTGNPTTAALNEAVSQAGRERLHNLLRNDLQEVIKELLAIPQVDTNQAFGQYGFNSLRFTQLSAKIKQRFDIKLSPAIYYSHVNIDKLCSYLIESRHVATLSDFYQSQLQELEPFIKGESASNPVKESFSQRMPSSGKKQPLAIVGMALQMPEAKNAEVFWKNLVDGLDCITEIPNSRWDWRNVEFGSGESNPYRMGGFIPNIRGFDASFFNISPREAELMDPQQRLFLQASYHALEDAGLSLEAVSGTNMGVFVGIVTSDYWDLVQKYGVQPDGYTISGNINCVIANRVSYQFNLRGPSAVIDTACSSSLVAMHRAIRAIQNGDCDSAIVGGVNVIASPYIHHSFSKNGMLSKDGHCMSFDDRANGYVRSEGVAAMVIKPLHQAEQDGDAIYGVILGSAENHGGRTNSLSAPSGEAQCELIVKAVEDAEIDVHSLSYIEAHGSGTPLGDPIEIDGIRRAFEQLGKHSQLQPRPCGIGSVKSNIGHLEAVAGQAGLAKVLLAFKHRTLPGMPMFINQNKHIDISGSPFYFTAQRSPWTAVDMNGQPTPRRAGVSSFGFGGVNAHVIVEEYTAENIAATPGATTNVLLLSAKSATQLRQLAEAYYRFLMQNEQALDWQSCCYTSQVGRSFFDERLLIEANTIQDACHQLLAFIRNESANPGYLASNVKTAQENYFAVFKDVDAEELTQPLLQKRTFSSLGRLWLAGVAINWFKAYADEPTTPKTRLPLYPFDEVDYWLPNAPAVSKRLTASPFHHPLLDSMPTTGVFVKHLAIDNPLIGDHLVNNAVIFPAVGYLEFARVAGDNLAQIEQQGKVISLKGNVWFQALSVGQQHKTLEISFEGAWPNKEYVIRSRDHQQQQIHARGTIEVSSNTMHKPAREDISAIKARCQNAMDRNDIYDLFSQLTFNYKDGYKPIQNVVFNSRESLAEVRLPEKFNPEYGQFILHPSLLEGGIQTVIGILANPEQDSSNAYLPFSMKSLTIYGALTKVCHVHAELTSNAQAAQRGIRKFNIRIFDSHGDCLVDIREYCLKTLTNKAPHLEHVRSENKPVKQTINNQDFYQLQKFWKPSAPEVNGALDGPVLVFSPTVDFAHHTTTPEHLITVVPREKYQYLGDNYYTVNPDNEDSITALFAHLEQQQRLPKHIIFAWSYSSDGDEASIDTVTDSVIKPFYAVCSHALKRLHHTHSRLIFAYRSKSPMAPVFAGINGLVRSLHQETTKIKATVIALEDDLNAEAQRLLDDLRYVPDSIEIRYANTIRMQADYRIESVNLSSPASKVLNKDDVYLITGGTGGIGRKLVRHLHTQYNAKLAIIGRQPLNETLCNEWADIPYEYHLCNISDLNALNECVARIEKSQGKITGVFHCAGTVADKLISKKSTRDIDPVVDPKVKGIYALDEATRRCSLTFFYGFSSISATMGNMGQTDYGYANAVIEEFCEWRNNLASKGQRSGKTLSLSWPLWLDGGMTANESAIRFFKESTGVEPISSEDGFRLLDFSLANLSGSHVIVRGNPSLLLTAVRKRSGLATSDDKVYGSISETTPEIKPSTQRDQPAQIEAVLLKLAASILKLKPESIHGDSVLPELGFDSIANTELATSINNTFGTDLTPVIFFEHNTLREVARHIASEHRDTIIEYFSQVTSDDEVSAVDAHSVIDHAGSQQMRNVLLANLKGLASSITKVPADRISDTTHLTNYGFDSISNTEFVSEINTSYKTDMTPVVLFEYHTLSELADYLLAEYPNDIQAALGNLGSSGDARTEVAEVTEALCIPTILPPHTGTAKTEHSHSHYSDDDIAIIGMQALMPDSENLEEFWLKLWDGQDFVREVPNERWSWRDVLGKASEDSRKTQSRWGSFIKDVDKFDAEFFGIDANEAALLDPQQRLFIQLVWHAIEDAGYKVSDFSGTRTGLYVGLSNRDYADYLQSNAVDISPTMSFGNNHAFLVNRISYLFDFCGPSEPIDTLCSSSLVAIHRAVQDIKAGICPQAIVGGISIMMSPRLSSVFEQAQMLSADGRCKSFDESADGFVRGEGGAAIVLKPLGRAKADRDNIIAVIKGSHTNHGGHANTLTAPNLKAQYQLIKEAYSRCGVHPATVSYIEAHGTGTKLGDPIEISALEKAFNEFNEQASGVSDTACGIGTIKTNIGHLEAASGIASVIKVLLSLRFKKLPGLIHLNNANPYIDLKKSPFYLLSERRDWQALTDTSGNALPRRAAINAFGAGGVNAHLILEEYPEGRGHADTTGNMTQSELILLSAKSALNLRAYAKSVSRALTKTAVNLSDIAYTLQVGRDTFDHRLAIICDDKDALIKVLATFADQGECPGGLYHVVAQSDVDVSAVDIERALEQYDLTYLRDIWLRGAAIDWRRLYDDEKPHRISLPGYPFSRTRHWIESRQSPLVNQTKIFNSLDKPIPDEPPVWHEDFQQGEPYLREHKVFDDEVLLGVTYPSMALEAARIHPEFKNANCVQRIVFYSPLSLMSDEYARVSIHFQESRNNSIAFESHHRICDRTVIEKSSSGTVTTVDRNPSTLDLESLLRDLTTAYEKQDIYHLLRTQGVDYQGSLTTVERILVGETQALSMISISDELHENFAHYALHPAWLDAAIVSAKFAFLHGTDAVYIPFSVNDVVLHRPPASRSYCLITRILLNEQILKCDAVICDERGNVYLEAFGIVCKRILSNNTWKRTKQHLERA
ncbi:amino acid adenylation domain-containing protein [Cellvibrio sp. ARAG 10.3]|uniref:amino acid adenylation domain-containing protein n=1 Tax=Cellvibrio sp. ARAG 10.3 TaxID=3451358 RepID=UPI003F46E636